MDFFGRAHTQTQLTGDGGISRKHAQHNTHADTFKTVLVPSLLPISDELVTKVAKLTSDKDGENEKRSSAQQLMCVLCKLLANKNVGTVWW